MAELMLINPKRKKRRKMTAKQRQYFGGGRRRKRTSVTVSARANPRRRKARRRRAVRSAAAPLRGPIRRSRRTRGRRRSGGFKLGGFNLIPGNFVKGTLVPSAIGGAGALAVDVLWNVLPVPANIKSGPLAPLVKVAGAIAVGAAVGAVAGRAMGEKATAGYLTVAAYTFLRDFVAKNVPAIPLSGYDGIGWVQSGQFVPDGMGQYLAPPVAVTPSVAAGMGSYISDYDTSGYYE